MKEYRIQEVNGAFELQERDAGTKKHFKIPYYKKGYGVYETHAEAQSAMDENVRVAALSDEEAKAELKALSRRSHWTA